MRKDAEANREKLVLAGKHLMQEQGGDVPVETICELAGVTRGTFYRNFSDRASIYQAVLEHELASMIAALAAPQEDPLAFLRLFAEMMMVYDKFLAFLPDMEDVFIDDGVSEAKMIAAITPALANAKSLRVIAEDITGGDVLLVGRMIAANWRMDCGLSKKDVLSRRLDLVLKGLAPQRK